MLFQAITNDLSVNGGKNFGFATFDVEFFYKNKPNLVSLLTVPDDLEELDLSNCPKLVSLPEKFPETLKKLNLSNCPLLNQDSKLEKHLTYLSDRGCVIVLSSTKAYDDESNIAENLENEGTKKDTFIDLLPKPSDNQTRPPLPPKKELSEPTLTAFKDSASNDLSK